MRAAKLQDLPPVPAKRAPVRRQEQAQRQNHGP
jgi:hypothetical protein